MPYTDFFKQIDTEEKAYWLGFIAADGNIAKDFSCCSIELKQSDFEHLQKFAKCFDNYYTVKKCKREYPSAKILITCKQCCYDLQQYGITPNKSLTLQVAADKIPLDLQIHYIRGYFDGDGSIFCSHPNRTSGYNYDEWGCNFVGTEHTLQFIQNYFHLSNKVRKKGKYFELDINGILPAYDILSLMYENASIYLDRKKVKYNELRSSQRLSELVSRREYTAEAKETSILVGFILSGATIRSNKIVKQAKKRDLLVYVQNIFEQYHYKTELVECSTNHGLSYQLRVQISPEITQHYKHQFYPNGNKTITRHLLNELNDDALSIWLTLNSHPVDAGIALGTMKFTEEENLLIQKYFQVVHKINLNLRWQRGKPYLFFPRAATEVLLTKVHVPRSTL